MRLINIHTLKLHEFVEGQIPPYAILSHRWTDQELTFKDLFKNRADPEEKGYKKLLGACWIANEYNVDYIWIDTCCIDKRSSAELSESINSMFAWYQKAEVCLAYLEDVEVGSNWDETLSRSVWFTRSWTLQELLAPRQVDFYDGQWTYFGSKTSIATALSKITAIRKDALAQSLPLHECSIAERMSWTVDRIATRSEDIAYSLLGIFDINMPLLYGEGSKAFTRLQEEILRRSGDATILCWGLHDPATRLLARSPADFRGFRGQLIGRVQNLRLATTNIGLELHATVVRWDLNTFGILLDDLSASREEYFLLVRKSPLDPFLHRVGIARCKIALGSRRTRNLSILWGNEEQLASMKLSTLRVPDIGHGFLVVAHDSIKLMPIDVYRGPRPRYKDRAKTTDGVNEFTWELGDAKSPTFATFECEIGRREKFWIDLAFDFDGQPCCWVYRKVRQNLRDPWDTPDANFPTGMGDEGPRQLGMQRIIGTNSWFLRSPSYRHATYAKLSDAIATDEHAWIFFSPSSTVAQGGHEKRMWKFGICVGRPQFDSENECVSRAPIARPSRLARILDAIGDGMDTDPRFF